MEIWRLVIYPSNARKTNIGTAYFGLIQFSNYTIDKNETSIINYQSMYNSTAVLLAIEFQL